MSAEHPPYNPLFLKAWIALSSLLGLLLLGMFLLGGHLLHYGYILWTLIRWLTYSAGIM